jgi:hypothetical protein
MGFDRKITNKSNENIFDESKSDINGSLGQQADCQVNKIRIRFCATPNP